MGKSHRHNPEENYDPEAEEQAWQRATDECRVVAERLASDDTLKKILTRHLLFEYQRCSSVGEPSPTEEDGIPFYRVGRNASHEFYLGYKDGVEYAGSYGDKIPDCTCYEKDPLAYPCEHVEYSFEYSPVKPGRVPYTGHF